MVVRRDVVVRQEREPYTVALEHDRCARIAKAATAADRLNAGASQQPQRLEHRLVAARDGAAVLDVVRRVGDHVEAAVRQHVDCSGRRGQAERRGAADRKGDR